MCVREREREGGERESWQQFLFKNERDETDPNNWGPRGSFISIPLSLIAN